MQHRRIKQVRCAGAASPLLYVDSMAQPGMMRQVEQLKVRAAQAEERLQVRQSMKLQRSE